MNTAEIEKVCRSNGCENSSGSECDDCVIERKICRWLPAVSEYASTCDGCGELCSHELQSFDEETQLGMCAACQERIII